MLGSDVLLERQAATIDYIETLERARSFEWGTLDAQASTVVQQLVLCHPGWLSDNPRLLTGLGLVGFRKVVARGDCQAEKVWGYRCPLVEHPVEADHLFPVALGGPAVGENMVWLCRLHNQWKSSDLAAYPWEHGAPRWLQGQLARVRQVVDVEARLDL